MIVGGGPSVGSSVGFPDPPPGSPSEIAAISRALSRAADDLGNVDGGLRGASATLAEDWQGYAAAAYHASSDGLASVARGGAESFRDCARAVSGYASALDEAQSEIHRLRGLYDAATAAEASATNAAAGLQNKLSSATKPAAVTKLNGRISSDQSDAENAAYDASGYARRASAVLDEFKQAQARYAEVLSGARLTPHGAPAPGGPFVPFEPAGAPGPGFGVPYTSSGMVGGVVPGLLASAYGGVVPVGDPWASPIPGYGIYEDQTTPEAVSTNDVANAVAFVVAPEAAGPAEDLIEAGGRALAERLGVGAARREAAGIVTENGSLALEPGAALSASEQRIADILVKHGNQVVARAPTGIGRTSDLLVNGLPYDVYTPTTGNVNRIVGAIASKSDQVSGGGVIVDLSRSPLSPEDLSNVGARVRGITGRIGGIRVIP